MYQIAKQTKKYNLSGFDFMNQNMINYIEFFREVKTNHRSNYINLEYFKYDVRKSLKGIIDHDFVNQLYQNSSYTCPFTGYKHNSLIPIAILTDKPIDYVIAHNGDDSPWYAEMACDPTWYKEEDITNLCYNISSVSQSLIGPGYTSMFYPNDGGADKSIIGIDLENGDTIVFVILKWYNK